VASHFIDASFYEADDVGSIMFALIEINRPRLISANANFSPAGWQARSGQRQALQVVADHSDRQWVGHASGFPGYSSSPSADDTASQYRAAGLDAGRLATFGSPTRRSNAGGRSGNRASEMLNGHLTTAGLRLWSR
jgi:hypothetical protein